jgi:hypothetical protein
MSISLSRIWTLAGALLVCATTAQAQVTTLEVEPNSVKAEATPVAGMVAGDMIQGNTTGTSLTAGSTLATTGDTFLVSLAPLPAGIYRHRLVATTTGTAGHTVRILGLTQTAGMINPGTSTTFQTSSTATTPPRYVQWYGFGDSGSLYVQIVGTASTTADYVLTLETVAVAPTLLTDCIGPGSLTIRTVGQGHTSDSDMWIYDSALDPIPGYGNDDAGVVGHTLGSVLTRTFAAGTYYIALTNFGFANDQASPMDDTFLTGAVMDFPNVAVNSSTTNPLILNVEISDGVKVLKVASTKVAQYEINWIKFEVSATPCANSSGAMYCFGDNSCPCANNTPVAAAQGCAHGMAGGAQLSSTGVSSVSADTLVLNATNLPFPPGGQGSILFFQGTTAVSAPFNDGKRCASGTVIRLGIKLHANFSTFASYPEAGDALISVKGAVGAPPATGSTRFYQGHYRSLLHGSCISGSNTTNGLAVVWLP